MRTKVAVSAVPVPVPVTSAALSCQGPRAGQGPGAAGPMTIDLIGSRDGSVDGCE